MNKPKKIKLRLDEIKVQSFATTVSSEEQNKIYGASHITCAIVTCITTCTSCTGGGANCC